MGKCSCHPEVDTNYLCMKHNVYLCEDCLKCRDPEIYCKFRSSCPIWFMQKKGIAGWSGGDETTREQKQAHTVVFLPDKTEVRVAEGTTLLEAAGLANVYLNASCNGKGSCGKCKLIVESGPVQNVQSPLLSDTEKKKT